MPIIIVSVCLICTVLFLCGCTIGFGGKTVYKFKGDETAYSIGDFSTGEAVCVVDIDWVRGDVIICPTTENVFSVTEEASGEISEDYRLRYSFRDGVLSIKFCKSGFSVDPVLPQKTLIVNVPGWMKLDRLLSDCVSANVRICRADIKTADIETVSGEIRTSEHPDMYMYSSAPNFGSPRFEVYSAEINTVSGDVFLEETVISFKRDLETVSGDISVSSWEERWGGTNIETVSGDVDISFSQNGGDSFAIDIETTSGDVKITLPENASAQIEYDTVSGDFECLRETTTVKKSGKKAIYTIGDGEQHIEVETVSGDLTVE